MRILIFNWRDWQHPWAGGAEIYTHEVAEQWVAQGHEVTLFCSSAPGLPDLDIAEGVAIVRRGHRFSVYSEARKFYEREARGRFDLVVDEVNTRPFGCPSFVKDVPVVALIHQVAREIWFREFPLPVALAGRYILEPRWLREYRDVPTVTVSESSRESLEMYGLKNVTVVPEGMTLQGTKKAEFKEQTPTVMFCGRMASNKRPNDAVAAYEILRDSIPESQLWMVGGGRTLKKLKRRSGDGVEFKDRVSHEEKFELMSRAHVLAVTSVREGWGLVVSEAAAAGTLSVGYDVPGLRDSVKASNGLLVEPRPEAMAEALAYILPKVVDGTASSAIVGGLAPWAEVAEGILKTAGVGTPTRIGVA